MARCKYCEQLMDWGQTKQGKWIPLIPLNDQRAEEFEKTYQDENGALRSLHAVVCCGRGPSVKIEKLPFPIKPS